jgi:hypothetical protein
MPVSVVNPFISFPATGGGSIPTSGLITDFDAASGCYQDAGTTLCTNNTLVQEWHAGGYSSSDTAVQTTSTDRPTWFSADGNGDPYVHFPGLEHMELTSSSSLYRDDDLTIYLVKDNLGAPGSFDTIFCKTQTFDWDFGWMIGVDGTDAFRSSINEWSAGQILNSDAGSGKEVCNFRFKTSAGTQYNKSRVNTFADRTGTTYTANDAPLKNALFGASWDAPGTGPTARYEGYVYRLLIYDNYHDDTQVTDIISTLMTQYSIT